MTDQEQQLPETIVSTENPVEISNDDQNPSSEKLKENEPNSSEQHTTRRITMPQDVRYSTEPNDREKLMEKYNNYQISDINACDMRFLTDNRQKKFLFGRHEEENSNLHLLAKTFNVNMFPGYQQASKHSYKIFGTEANVRKCLIEIMNRMFKRSNRSNQRDIAKSPEIETDDKSLPPPTSIFVTTINRDSSITEEKKTVTPNIENTDNEKLDDKSPPHPTTIFVTTINPDSSITEEKKTITPTTNDDNTEQEELKFIPLERKPQYTFVALISNQGQEVLKKNWTFFAGSLQQRLNVIVTNPVRLPKFGDKQILNELSITGEIIENLADATLQIAAFINDVLGVPVQPFKANEEPMVDDKKNQNHRQGRTFLNRNRNGIFEQLILIRSDCVPRIIGTRGSNLKRIQAKCHLRDMIVGRTANENGYVECTLTAYQARNIHFGIDTIRNFLRNEDDSAVIVIEPNHEENAGQDSPHLHELGPPNTSELQQTGFKSLNVGNNTQYPQPTYNFQNTPSFDFTHQATSASRKTDKRRGELNENNKTPNESQNQQYELFSPKHKSKRSCPETKEIDCTTDEGFWIQKQYYYALDDTSKELFDSLIEKLEKIRIATEENVARKQQRLVGRNRSNKSKGFNSSIPYLNEDNNNDNKEKDLTIKSTQIENNTKVDETSDVNEEKENKQETPSITVNQD